MSKSEFRAATRVAAYFEICCKIIIMTPFAQEI